MGEVVGSSPGQDCWGRSETDSGGNVSGGAWALEVSCFYNNCAVLWLQCGISAAFLVCRAWVSAGCNLCSCWHCSMECLHLQPCASGRVQVVLLQVMLLGCMQGTWRVVQCKLAPWPFSPACSSLLGGQPEPAEFAAQCRVPNCSVLWLTRIPACNGKSAIWSMYVLKRRSNYSMLITPWTMARVLALFAESSGFGLGVSQHARPEASLPSLKTSMDVDSPRGVWMWHWGTWLGGHGGLGWGWW